MPHPVKQRILAAAAVNLTQKPLKKKAPPVTAEVTETSKSAMRRRKLQGKHGSS